MTADTPAAAPRSAAPSVFRALDAINVLIVLALAVLLASFAVRNSDFWLHLAAGRLIAAGEFAYGSDPFSALVPAPLWIHHAWLFDLLLFLLFRAAGGAAVVVAKAALVAVMAAVLLLIRRPRADGWTPVLLTAIALLAMAPRLLLQPALVSYLFAGVLLLILTRVPRRRTRWHRPLSVGILFALWVNLDGGFPVGLTLLGLWLVGQVLQRAMGGEVGEGQWSPGEVFVALLAACIGCLVNPYFYRVFLLPSDFAFLTIPAELRGDELFFDLFRSPLDKSYATYVAGTIPAMAYFALIGLGIGSFALNLRGWCWPRALVWLALAAASLTLARLVPYFAVVAAPLTVLNLQDFAARRKAGPLDARAAFTSAFVGGFGRFLTLVAGLGLLAFAWPGGFAADAGTYQQFRRVAWDVIPEPTWVKAAEQLAAWHESGRIPRGEGRGFYLQPTFGYYCAWACPAEKMVFDLRLTNPATTADYIGVRKELLAMRFRPDAAPAPILHRLGITHLVLTGRAVLEQQLGRVVLNRPDRFPLYAITGCGVMTGWRDGEMPEAFPALRLDAVRLAATSPLVPAPASFPEPPAATGWDRYRAAPPPVPAESYESALWMVAREEAAGRATFELVAARSAEMAAAIGRSAPAGLADLANQMAPPILIAQALQDRADRIRQNSPGIRLSRVAPLLAVRAARRAILANPDNYEAYQQLVSAYLEFDTDRDLTFIQRATAARQALDRIPQATGYGQFTAPDALALHTLLLQLYEGATVLPGRAVQPLDLLLESFERVIELEPAFFGSQLRFVAPEQRGEAQKKFDEDIKKKIARLDALRQAVRKTSDNYENRAAKATPVRRAEIAAEHGLVREALTVLRGIDAQQRTQSESELLLYLELFAGQAENAYAVLQMKSFHPVTVLPRELQSRFRAFNLQTSAALGDYANAIEALDSAANAPIEAYAESVGYILQSFVFADLGASPLARIATSFLWGGFAPKNAEPGLGMLLQLRLALQHQADASARQGVLALEQGDLALARKRFRHALTIAGPLDFSLRPQTMRWLDLFRE